MSVESVIQDILSVEEDISYALEQDDFDKANELVEVRNEYIKKLGQEPCDNEKDKELRTEFAKSLLEFTKERTQELLNERENTRLDLIKLKKGSNGLNKYSEVKRRSF